MYSPVHCMSVHVMLLPSLAVVAVSVKENYEKSLEKIPKDKKLPENHKKNNFFSRQHWIGFDFDQNRQPLITPV